MVVPQRATPVFGFERQGHMSKLAADFSKKQWKKCCGKGCDDCKVYGAYIKEYGKKTGKKKFASDHDKHH